MEQPETILTAIAHEHLRIPTLQTQCSDRSDFYDLAVWQVEAALRAAFNAGARFAGKNAKAQRVPRLVSDTAAWPTSNLSPNFSPPPWAYEYNPYIAHDNREIPAFEVCDHNGNRVFMTEEDQPIELQEANARLGAVAPRLLVALDQLLCIFDEEIAQGILWDDPRIAEARHAITEATCSAKEKSRD